MSRSDKDRWVEAIKDELKSIEELEVYKLVHRANVPYLQIISVCSVHWQGQRQVQQVTTNGPAGCRSRTLQYNARMLANGARSWPDFFLKWIPDRGRGEYQFVLDASHVPFLAYG